MSDGRREIDELRVEIGKVDHELVKLVDRRAKLARKIADARKDAPNAPFVDRAAMMEVAATSSGDMPEAPLREILSHIYAECLALELPVPIAYAGAEGGFSHAAATSRFGVRGAYAPKESAREALEDVTHKRAQFAVVPFETRADGPVHATILALMASDLRVVACYEVAENLDLISKTGNFADIEKVYATPQDHAACLKFFATEAPHIRVEDVKSPAIAHQRARDEKGAAALAAPSLGGVLDLSVVKKSVRDSGDDRVRYAVVGARPSSRTGNDLTALAISVADSPGALHEVLRQFAEHEINLTKIQSRPAPGDAWVYLFFIEVKGHVTDRNLVTALEEVKRLTKYYRVLGSYQAP